MGIKSCNHKGLKELYCNGRTTRIGARYLKSILLILNLLDDLVDIKDCEGVKDFHPLKGSRKGTYSMRVMGNYCVTFKWDGEHAYELDFEDYH
jgi:proteic killer suppression protein